MPAYYNELDPFAAQWLRNLIAAGHIAPGEVDERSILDVDHRDLRGFDQCHFFAGIGVWSYALRCAGWRDDRPVWTGSCPCQPFSAAGAGKEFADERHLWPAWFELIRLCRPVAIFGEQVASRDALAWLDHVCADLEAEGYAVGAVDTCAAGYGAPHIRQRLYWVANANGLDESKERPSDEQGREQPGRRGTAIGSGIGAGGGVDRLADDNGGGREIVGAPRLHDHGEPGHDAARCGEDGIVADTARRGFGVERDAELARDSGHLDGGEQFGCIVGDAIDARPQGHERPGDVGLHGGTGTHGSTPTAGFWSDAEWLPCRDGKARPTEPGTFPLVAGAPQRVGRLRAYGNSIVGPQAAAFVQAFLDCRQ